MNSADQVRLQVERLLAHHIAHDLNNHLGGVEVLVDMMQDDVTDPAAKNYIQKIQFAARMARGQVQALRFLVPKHGASRKSTMVKAIWPSMLVMLLGQEKRVVTTLPDILDLVGDTAIVGWIFYTLLSHALGGSTGPVTVGLDHLTDTEAVIFVQAETPFNPLVPDQPLWDQTLLAHHITIVPHDDQAGWILHWPLGTL